MVFTTITAKIFWISMEGKQEIKTVANHRKCYIIECMFDTKVYIRMCS